MSYAEIKEKALQLEPEERLDLSEILWESVEVELDQAEDVSEDVLIRRLEELKTERVKGIALQEAFPDLRAKGGTK